MNRTIILLLALVLLIIVACTEDSPISPESNLIVVRGYIYAGEPVNNIQLTSTLPLGSEETKAPPINDASVLLLKDSQQYELALSEGDSGYYHYDGNDLTVEAGDQFSIEVSYQDQQIYGTTNVPEAPKNVTICDTVGKLKTFPFRVNVTEGLAPDVYVFPETIYVAICVSRSACGYNQIVSV